MRKRKGFLEVPVYPTKLLPPVGTPAPLSAYYELNALRQKEMITEKLSTAQQRLSNWYCLLVDSPSEFPFIFAAYDWVVTAADDRPLACGYKMPPQEVGQIDGAMVLRVKRALMIDLIATLLQEAQA